MMTFWRQSIKYNYLNQYKMDFKHFPILFISLFNQFFANYIQKCIYHLIFQLFFSYHIVHFLYILSFYLSSRLLQSILFALKVIIFLSFSYLLTTYNFLKIHCLKISIHYYFAQYYV